MFFTTFLNYPNKDIIPEHRVKAWRDAKKFLDKHAHSRKKDISPDAPVKLELHFRYLDNILYEAATNVIRPSPIICRKIKDLVDAHKEGRLRAERSIHEILEETNQ